MSWVYVEEPTMKRHPKLLVWLIASPNIILNYKGFSKTKLEFNA
jgi:hypothetical protein